MKHITISPPDSVEMSEQEIQALVLEEIYKPVSETELVKLTGRPVPSEHVAEIRRLVALYFAERATRLVDFQAVKWLYHLDTSNPLVKLLAFLFVSHVCSVYRFARQAKQNLPHYLLNPLIIRTFAALSRRQAGS